MHATFRPHHSHTHGRAAPVPMHASAITGILVGLHTGAHQRGHQAWRRPRLTTPPGCLFSPSYASLALNAAAIPSSHVGAASRFTCRQGCVVQAAARRVRACASPSTTAGRNERRHAQPTRPLTFVPDPPAASACATTSALMYEASLAPACAALFWFLLMAGTDRVVAHCLTNLGGSVWTQRPCKISICACFFYCTKTSPPQSSNHHA